MSATRHAVRFFVSKGGDFKKALEDGKQALREWGFGQGYDEIADFELQELAPIERGTEGSHYGLSARFLQRPAQETAE